ncbi:hypothetical protein WA026_008426 [Henosepilachna vigintioctopunctata]|uniref:Uncharacterized protein n=1 Tax=Henosepilachna vigintioctopunctata TaxID=420089 RepID=A0AAW1UHC4_9CUCU
MDSTKNKMKGQWFCNRPLSPISPLPSCSWRSANNWTVTYGKKMGKVHGADTSDIGKRETQCNMGYQESGIMANTIELLDSEPNGPKEEEEISMNAENNMSINSVSFKKTTIWILRNMHC